MPTQAKHFHVRFRAADAKDLAKLPIHQMDIGCMGGFRRQDDGSYALEAVASDKLLAKLKRPSVTIEVLADLEEENERAKKIKSKQIDQGNRYEGKDWIPRGLGKKVREGDAS
jgi:hypothetical protein